MELPWEAGAFRAALTEFYDLLVPGAWAAWCLNNHDYSRLATRYGAHAVRAAAMLLVTLRGTPFLFQGEELGLEDVPVAPEQVVDVDGRDPQRAPMPWAPPSQAGPGAGFTTGQPWLPLTRDAERVNAATQASDPRSILALYRALLALRRDQPDLQDGPIAFAAPDAAEPDVLRYTRGPALAVALNFAPEPRAVRWPAGARTVLATGLDREAGTPAPGELRGGEGVVAQLS
jgi:alpha-glucosidase